MKFKCRDTVRCAEWHNYVGKIVRIDGHPYYPYILDNDTRWGEKDLVLVKPAEETKDTTTMRQFESGATRDSVDHPEKPNYIKALSPIVLREYVKYLGRHRVQADGSVRDWDNWKKGIPIDVYLEGLARHEMAVWLILQGFKSYDNNGEVNLIDSLCGIMFNVQGLLHETIKETLAEENKCQSE